jgi:tRNA A-37 threonylcarbamoyl transferase component Bud32
VQAGPRRNPADLVGEVLDGRYRLDAVIGEGGMGAVFRAQQLAMDRRVAVKVLKPHLASDQVALQRFIREARGTLKVDSPNAVKVLDFGATADGFYYLVLEFLDGRTVQRELDVDGPFRPRRVVHVARQVVAALGAAHRIGLVHRDVKPDNILLSRLGDDPDHAKVLDFGVAKLMEGAATPAMTALKLTQAGTVFGTPEYMSPEQACGLALDGRSDLYALAVTMFVMATGRPLFPRETTIAVLTAHVRTEAPRLGDVAPELGDTGGLDPLLARCLSKRPEDRPASAEALDAALAEIEARLATRPVVAVTAATVPLRPIRLGTSETCEAGYVTTLPSAFGDTLGATVVDAPRSRTGPGDAAAPPGLETAPRRGQTTGTTGTTTGTAARAVVPPRHRGLLLALGVAVLGAIVATFVVVARHPGRAVDAGPPRRPPAVVAPSQDAAPADPTMTTSGGGAVDADPAAAAPTIDAGSAPITPPGPRPPPASAGPTPADLRHAKAEAHLRLARAARRDPSGALKQISEADAALAIEPDSPEANFLLGDALATAALATSSDVERACRFLRLGARFPGARARAAEAKCPK